jgi:hypothetical protein
MVSLVLRTDPAKRPQFITQKGRFNLKVKNPICANRKGSEKLNKLSLEQN